MRTATLTTMSVAVAVLAFTARPPQGTRFQAESAIPNAQLVRALSRSHRSLVTDLYWIRAISHTIQLKVPADGRTLINWCRFVTELDPDFVWPYILGGLLGVVQFDLQYSNVQEANELLARGFERMPHEYRLAIYLSFNQLEMQRDPKAAAETLRKGALAPGAPPFMSQLATRLLAQTGEFGAARAFAAQMAQSDDPVTRAFFERRLAEIDRDEAIERIQRAVDAFRTARGSLPQSLLQLSLEGFLVEVPVDPLGGTFVIDPESGRVSSTSGARLEAKRPATP